MPASRAYDVVLFGATGFTGALTAEYLATHAPHGCRWALAGRNVGKLEAVRDRLTAINPAYADLELLTADIGDAASLRAVAESTRVLVTTVGPYLELGEPLVAACAEAGTDYLDLTGEPEFVDRMFVRYHDAAVASGARLVHAAGFDSIPFDLGVYFTVQQLPSDRPIHVDGFIRAGGTVSGGTFASALTAFSRARQMGAAARERRQAEARPADRSARAVAGVPHFDKAAHAWALPMPTIDPQIVARSGRALTEYGPQFSYSHYAAVKTIPMAAAGVFGVGALAVGAQIPLVRRQLSALRPQGEGPDEATRERGWFTARFVGTAGEDRVVTEVSGGDPGYTETAKMLSESALCLAFDDVPSSAGQVTTAVAMGDALVKRLTRADIAFTVLDGVPEHPPTRRR